MCGISVLMSGLGLGEQTDETLVNLSPTSQAPCMCQSFEVAGASTGEWKLNGYLLKLSEFMRFF